MQALAFGGIALFLPLIRDDVHISFSQAGTLGAVTTLTYAIMQMPAGYLADRYNPKKLFLAGIVGVNLLSMSFAVLHSYPLLLLNQGASGIFRSLVFAPGLLLMSRQFRSDRQATAMGLYVAGGMSSNILLNLIGPVLVGPLGWRMLFVLFSVTGLVVVLLFWKLGEDAPQRAHDAQPLSGIRSVLAHPVVWVCGFIQFVRLAVTMGVAFWLPSLIVDDKGYSLQVAGAVVAIGAAVTAPSNFLGGWLSDRLDRPVLVIGGSLSMLAVTLSLIPIVHNLVLLIGVIALMSVFVQFYFGPLFALPLKHAGPGNPGLVSGFSNFCANIGSFTFSLVLGQVKDATGSFSGGLYVLASLCVVAAVATVFISRLPKPIDDRTEEQPSQLELLEEAEQERSVTGPAV